MRNNERRLDNEAATKLKEVRDMKNAFGGTAAKRFAEQYFLHPELVRIALSSRHERRQRLRRSMDRPEGTESIPLYR